MYKKYFILLLGFKIIASRLAHRIIILTNVIIREPSPRFPHTSFLSKKILGNPLEFLGSRHTRHITARFARAEF